MSDDDTGKPHPSAYAKALGMLARREQSRRELERKLGRQGFERDESESALDRLAGQHYQDDGRFAGMLARGMIRKGYLSTHATKRGPRRR